MKVGVLIPTRGDRPQFLQHARWLLSQQSRQADMVEIVDDPPRSRKPDITRRYRIGCERLFAKGADVILFWEDDDWYSRDYIKRMTGAWLQAGNPPIFGIAESIYYHIGINKYSLMPHPGRASMMATLVGPQVKAIYWGEDNYSFTDMHLWTRAEGQGKDLSAY